MRRLFPLLVLTAVVVPTAHGRPMKGDPVEPADALNEILGRPASGGDTVATVVGGLATAMGDISADLSKQQTGTPVQTKQKAVATSLDGLIKDLEQQCNGSGGGNLNPTQGLKKSILAGGPGGIGDLHDVRAGEKQWGALKPKDREQILQAKTDGFPAGYESLLQSYYRRLSTEDDSTPAATATDAPAAAPTTAPAGTARP